jgi:hypothetical protein
VPAARIKPRAARMTGRGGVWGSRTWSALVRGWGCALGSVFGVESQVDGSSSVGWGERERWGWCGRKEKKRDSAG